MATATGIAALAGEQDREPAQQAADTLVSVLSKANFDNQLPSATASLLVLAPWRLDAATAQRVADALIALMPTIGFGCLCGTTPRRAS